VEISINALHHRHLAAN